MTENINYTNNTLTLFDSFINEFLINKKSLADGKDLFTKDNGVTINKIEELLNKSLGHLTKLNKPQPKKNTDDKANSSKDNSEDKSLQSFLEKSDNIKFQTIIWHAYWIMYLMGENTKKLHKFEPEKTCIRTGENGSEDLLLYITNPIASTKQVYTKNPIDPFKTLLSLFCHIWNNLEKMDNVDSVKDKIKVFLNDKDKNNIDNRIKNLLLYLCAPKEYLPILSEDHKNKIYTNLKFILDNNKNNTHSEQKENSETKTTEEENIDTILCKEENSETKTTEEESIDTILCKIEAQLKKLLSKNQDPEEYNTCDAVYDPLIKHLWSKEPKTGELPSDILLKYKKAMVLYGPPGTGKTYTAANLAKKLLFTHMFEEWKKAKNEDDIRIKSDEISKILNLKEEALDEHPNISYLQFHINYTYENFIAGQTVKTDKNSNTTLVTKPGFIYDIIKKANTAIVKSICNYKNVEYNEKDGKIDIKERDLEEIKKIKQIITKDKELQKTINAAPFIVILDEMNRVDVSRVFGELFTAIEKRGTDVFLTLPDPEDESKRLKLNIPYNIYFIGTMNEIDFSLEQIDFALRRRFIWELADYSENALEEIITRRIKNIEKIGDTNITYFLKNCTALNKRIADSLAEEYHIGHVFFAEIANIYNELAENGSSDKAFKQAQNILWQISIKPTIEAYCGTMEKNAKKTFINECYTVFFKSGNE